MKRVVSTILFLALIVAVVLYATGAFHGPGVAPARLPSPPGETPPERTATARKVEVAVTEEAVGTVVSRTQVDVAAQVTARVKSVHAQAGSRVEEGSPLIELDDRELAARRGQAEDALRQAQAARDRAVQAKASADAVLVQAHRHFERIEGLLKAKAATPEQLENAETGLLQAQAGVAEAEAAIAAASAEVERSQQALEEASVALGHAQIAAPITGVVAMKSVEPGDLAWPGKTLMQVLDPVALRVEAQVREGLIARIERGGEYEVEVPSAARVMTGTVAEICPTADPRSRTFRVRVDFDPVAGIHPGMYGRMRIPTGTRTVVEVPQAAIERVGQLAMVLVKEGDRWVRRTVTTGRRVGDPAGDGVEVLSGLEGDEVIGLGESR